MKHNGPIVLTGNTRTLGKAADIFPKRNATKFQNNPGDVRINYFFNGQQAFIRAHIFQLPGEWRNFALPGYAGGVVPYTVASRVHVTEDVFELIAALREATAQFAEGEYTHILPTSDVTLTGKVWAWAEAGEVLRDISLKPAAFKPGDVRIQYAYDKPKRRKYIRVMVYHVYWRPLALPGTEDGVVEFKSNASRNRASNEVLHTVASYAGRVVTWKGKDFEISLTEEDQQALDKRCQRLDKAAERVKRKNQDLQLTGGVWTQGGAAFNFRSHELTDDSTPRSGDIVIWVPSLRDSAPRARYKGGLIRAAIFRGEKRCAFAMRDEAMAEMTFNDEGGRDACIRRAIDVIGGLSGRHATWTKGTYYVPMLNPEAPNGAAGPTEGDPVEAPPVEQPEDSTAKKVLQPAFDFDAPLPVESGSGHRESHTVVVLIRTRVEPPTDLFGHPIQTGKTAKRKRK
jgi:hypothetical protein